MPRRKKGKKGRKKKGKKKGGSRRGPYGKKPRHHRPPPPSAASEASCDEDAVMKKALKSAQEFYDRQQWVEAIAEFTKILKIDPKNVLVLEYRAWCHFHLQDYRSAISDFLVFIEENQDPLEDVQARNAISLAYENLGESDRAIRFADSAVNAALKAPKASSPSALTQLSLLYVARGKRFYGVHLHRRALTDFDEAVRIAPDRYELHLLRGKHLALLKEGERALADYCKAIRLNPSDGRTWNARGRLRTRMGQLDDAIKDFSKSIDLEPDGGYAGGEPCLPRVWRGLIYHVQGRSLLSSADLTEATRLLPSVRTIYEGHLDKPATEMFTSVGFAPLPPPSSEGIVKKPEEEEEEEEGELIKQAEGEKKRKCSRCTAEASEDLRLSQCGGCGRAWYCSRECQKNDWKHHRGSCHKTKTKKTS